MKSASLVAGLAVTFTALTAAAADWEDIKSPAELRALYSDKTFKGKDWMDRPWVGHYRADGRGVLVTHDGSRIPRTWAVEGADRVCVESQFPRVCFRFQRDKSQAGVYRSINVANDMATVIVVEDGVPKF
jgi:hypothetical protein